MSGPPRALPIAHEQELVAGPTMPRFAANITMLFNEVPFLDRFAAAAAAGFTAVECQSPYDFDKSELSSRLEESGLGLVLHNLPAGDWAAGERGIAILPDRGEEFRAGVATAIAYAKALGCRQINCLAGIRPHDIDDRDLQATFVANLRYAADRLGREGIRLLIEMINTRDMPGFYLSTTRQARDILERVGSDNLYLQYDVYHMQIMEGGVASTIAENLGRIGHIQVADAPGRHEPGTGEIDFPFLLAHLDAIGYGGWVGCEYKPKTTTAGGLGWLETLGRRAAGAAGGSAVSSSV